MRFRFLLISYIVIFSITSVLGQKSQIQIGSQVPLMYSIGYEYDLSNKISFNTQVGVLTKPYDVAILKILQTLGTSDEIIFAIEKSFNYGYILQPTIKYHISDYYVGLTYSYYSLYSNNVKKHNIENRFGFGFNFPFQNNQNLLSLNSKLSNAGVTVGRIFDINNIKLKFLIEISMQKTFYSKSTLTSDLGVISSLNDKVNTELNQYYLKYGFLPSINFFLSKSF